MKKKIAFLFPGQGSQYLGMLQDYQNKQIVRSTFQEASDTLGFDLQDIISKEGSISELNSTKNTQPALLTASVALWRYWLSCSDYLPDFLAGHSLGEFSALTCSGALKFTDAVQMVHKRGLLMQEAVNENSGAMAALIGLNKEDVQLVCQEAAQKEIVEPANFNSPIQTVIAGDRSAILRAIDIAKKKGVKRAILLPVSVPSHCSLMQTAAKKLEQELSSLTIKHPTIPIIHNVNASPCVTIENITPLLTRQLYQPVKWVDSIQYLHDQNVKHFVECGAGKVLSGLNKRIISDSINFPIDSIREFNHFLQFTNNKNVPSGAI